MHQFRRAQSDAAACDQAYRRRSRREFLLESVGIAAVLAGATALAQETFGNVERIVAVGDVHADYQRFVSLLQAAQLIDGKRKWIGGNAHLVQVGDVLDRGLESRQVMDLLMELEPQAAKAGGRVHALLGNHEAMNLAGDLRYVSKQEYAVYQGRNSERLRDQYFHLVVEDLKRKKALPADVDAFRKTFDAEHPLGWVERLRAFLPQGKYGKWLRQHPAIIKINDVVFLHGGIGPKYESQSIKEINESIRAELSGFPTVPTGMATDPDGPLWYRGLAEAPESSLAEHVSRVLENYGARHLVIGHTVQPTVLPRFAGRVILIDVGLSKVYGGPPEVLIIENGNYSVLDRGHRLDLPVDGGNLLPYLKAAAALDPQPSPIQALIERQARGALVTQ